MFFLLRQIRHLTRYFFILGGLAFYLHYRNSAPDFSLILMGPSIYLAYFLKLYAGTFFKNLPSTPEMNDFGYLLPVTLFYFTLLGFLFKQLWNERGFIRTLTLIALTGFLGFIHFLSWQMLSGYSTPNL